MTLRGDWSYPTTIWFGAGRLNELGAACAAAGVRRPLLVTDRGLAELPITARALDALDAAGFGRALCGGAGANPTEADLDFCLEAYRAGGHDGVVAFGGGSGLDVGKMVAFMCGQSRPVWDFEDIGDLWRAADADAIAPVVAVPTTAGTGSEVSRSGVILNSATREKKIIFHPGVMPRVVVLDPELTLGVPATVTAGTGMDAFAHCLEAYCSAGFHPMADGVAVEGLRLVKENLPRAYRDGGDLEARGGMQVAAMMGAVSFQGGLGAVHALSHPVGAVYGTHHGTTNGVVLPAVLRFNRDVIEARVERLCGYLGLSGGFDGFYEFVCDLNGEIGIPGGLGELGVEAERLDELARAAVKDPTAASNPVEMTFENTLALYRSAM
ncbi:MAG: iron-containing alcohol dehydrogenase [Alphaproteobacteria bacterium]|nr:iron-containing alcohol dehydrogenase [Alphaproteobacteria bacterium]MDA7989376.1 iron-containing alcohol dehydrogenase [Alphaproteobacteria bacterium]